MSIEKHYKPKEVAAFMGVDAATVRAWIKSGKLLAKLAPGCKTDNPKSRRWLIPESAINAALKDK